jgi:hypothetical protein
MSLSIQEIETEILTLPEQEQLKLIDFVESLKSKFIKKQTALATHWNRAEKNEAWGGIDSSDLSENYKAYLYSREPIEKGQVSPIYKAFDEAGLIGCIETDEQLSTSYKEKIDFSFKHGEAK